MIESIRLEADKLKISKPLHVLILEVLLRIPWALGWLAGCIWHIVTLIVAALIVGFKTGRG